MLGVVVLNYNDAETTEKFVRSLKDYTIPEHIIVVDNCSTDDSLERLSELFSDDPRIDIIETGANKGYGAGNNYGVRFAVSKYQCDHLLICNPDTMIAEETIRVLQDFLKDHPKYAVAAPFMHGKDGEKMANTAFKLPTKWQYIFSLGMIYSKFVHSMRYRDILSWEKRMEDVGAVSGSLLMINTGNFINAGMYDENIFLYCEEVALGKRLEANGFKTALLAGESFYHIHSVSISKNVKREYNRIKILIKSKKYVIREYYKANCFEYAAAQILSIVLQIENFLFTLLKYRKV